MSYLLFSRSDHAWSSEVFGNLSNLHASQKDTNLLQHIMTICILVTKKIDKALDKQVNLR